MPTPFEQMLQQDAVNVFAGSSDFGELITVRDNNGIETEFYAQVFRTPPALVPDSRGMDMPPKPMPVLATFLPMDPLGVNGVSCRPDPGGVWAVYTAENVGEQPQWFPIVSIIGSDPGGYMVKLK